MHRSRRVRDAHYRRVLGAAAADLLECAVKLCGGHGEIDWPVEDDQEVGARPESGHAGIGRAWEEHRLASGGLDRDRAGRRGRAGRLPDLDGTDGHIRRQRNG